MGRRIDEHSTADLTLAASVVAELRNLTGTENIRLSLSNEGERLLHRLGSHWLSRIAICLTLAYPAHALALELVPSDSDPIPTGEDLSDPRGRARVDSTSSVGRLQITPSGAARGRDITRVVHLPGHALLDAAGDFHFLAPTSRKRRVVGAVYKQIYARTPLVLDRWRQSRNTRLVHNRIMVEPVPGWTTSAGTARGRKTQGKPAFWVAMHWLEAGGAETWAIQAVELAREAGYEVVVTVDVPAPQRLLARLLDLTPHVYVPANVLAEQDWHSFFVGILQAHNVRAVHIHHSNKVYDFLPALRHLADDVYVLDSTHIVEHRTGGFVRRSIQMSAYVDEHHVISPELRDVYLLESGIAATKLSYHPLTSPDPMRRKQISRPLGCTRIGFLGRLAPQKRPFLFVDLCRRLHRREPGRFTFLMQGSGPLAPLTSSQIQRSGLDSVIERRPWGPTEDFMSEIDVLVVCSDNEGLTLTSLEAEQHGVLVLSADVGSQRTVTAEQMLVPRAPDKFLSQAEKALWRLVHEPGAYERASRDQEQLIGALAAVPPSSAFLRDRLASLKGSH